MSGALQLGPFHLTRALTEGTKVSCCFAHVSEITVPAQLPAVVSLPPSLLPS